MIVTEIIARLKTEATPRFRLVEGAAGLAALGNGAPNAVPAAYVFSAEEAAGENERVTAVLQRLEIDVSVVVVASNLSDATGGAAAADIERLKKAVRKALIGWQPASADDVITYVGARLIRAREGYVWVEMTFAVATYEED